MTIRLGSVVITTDQAAQVQRLVGLGATELRQNHDPDDDFVVLADPEGNLLCVCQLTEGDS